MKILHISDTHGCHHRLRDLPEADVAVHSGDFCMVGTTTEAIGFATYPTSTKYSSAATTTIACMVPTSTDLTQTSTICATLAL